MGNSTDFEEKKIDPSSASNAISLCMATLEVSSLSDVHFSKLAAFLTFVKQEKLLQRT